MKNLLNLKWDSVSYAYLDIMKMREKELHTVLEMQGSL